MHGACLRMVLLTDVYRNLTSLWIKPREHAFKQFKSPVLSVLISNILWWRTENPLCPLCCLVWWAAEWADSLVFLILIEHVLNVRTTLVHDTYLFSHSHEVVHVVLGLGQVRKQTGTSWFLFRSVLVNYHFKAFWLSDLPTCLTSHVCLTVRHWYK